MLNSVLIAVAGWGYPASALDGLCRALAPGVRAVPVAARDLWLRGRAEAGEAEQPLSRYAAGLLALIRERGDGAPAVAGWSLGGVAALELAARCPERIGRLALISSTPKFCSADGWPCGVPPANVRAMRRGLQRDPGKVLAGFYRLAAEPLSELAAAEPVQPEAAADDLPAGLDYLLATDLRPCLRQVGIPVLVVHGREDRVVPWQAGEQAHRALPGSRLCLHDGLGHDLPLRAPEKVADNIREFLSG